MKILTFLVKRFAWQSHAATLEELAVEVPEGGASEAVDDALVAFLHIEAVDTSEDGRKRAFTRTLKHLKWLANKKQFKTIVLHSFTHLGGESAPPAEARAFLDDLDARLSSTGYTVRQTPFGWNCTWDLSIYGESVARVWKAF